MKGLVLEELTVEQKIGQLLCVRGYLNEDDRAFVYEMLRKKSVGAVQVRCDENSEMEIQSINEAAGYPVLICADMERGFPLSQHKIPAMMALAATNSVDLAYQTGCVTAIEAKRIGFNTVWGPNVDMVMGPALSRVTRTFGSDPHLVSKMGSAMVKGYLDNGMFATAKHFPGGRDITVDTHMVEGESLLAEQDILDVDIIPYAEAIKNSGLSGVMTKHVVYPKIDPVYPASLSSRLIGILRNQGFDGLVLTDSFAMMGILQKYKEDQCYGLAVAAGNDMVLPNYRISFKQSYEYMLDAYRRGVITDERLDEAVSRVIRAQNSTLRPAQYKQVTDYHKTCMQRVTQESICAVTDEDVSCQLTGEKRRLFVVMYENLYHEDLSDSKEIIDNEAIRYNNLAQTEEIIHNHFPDATIVAINQFPNQKQIENVCYASTLVDEVVYLTYCNTGSYMASESLTEKVVNMMRAMKQKIAAVIHIGNPYAMEAIPHVPRVLFGFGWGNTVECAIRILSGEQEAKGILPVKIKLQ